MTAFERFKKSLLPGNYALTKSMEVDKVQSSGSLWYLKKYIVLYNTVYLTNDIETDEYIQKVINCFDKYISGLAEEQKKGAKEFFYSQNKIADFRSPEFKSFMQFANKTSFSDIKDKQEHFLYAKNAYFNFLMGAGGQHKIKKRIVDGVAEKEFTYSAENMEKLIFNSVINYCAENAGDEKQINTGDVRRILSVRAIDEILALGKNADETEIRELVFRYPCSPEYPGEYSGKFVKPNYRAVESDAFAHIRNERQLFYYYGYFHTKQFKKRGEEFSSLTPVGELALDAGAAEFAALWEHQKIKMISQPPTAVIEDIKNIPISADKFSVSRSPYLDIIGCLKRNGSFTTEQYRYVISRKNNVLEEKEWQESEKEILNKQDEIKEAVKAFKRSRDVKSEDSDKELKKYLLGIRSDLKFDKNKNFINACNITNSNVLCSDSGELSLLYQIYERLNNYKKEYYEELFKQCENDLRRRYMYTAENGKKLQVDPKVKINWDLYNIRFDRFIFTGVMIAMANIAMKRSFEEINSEETVEYCISKFKSILKMAGFRFEKTAVQYISKAIDALKKEEYEEVFHKQNEVMFAGNTEHYMKLETGELKKKIKDVSALVNVSKSADRTRNKMLVRYLKTYYLKKNNGKLDCECCRKEGFITRSGLPYAELHHIIPFSVAYGPDHYLNFAVLCPSCHRKLHYMATAKKAEYYENFNKNNYIGKTIIERLKALKAEKQIKSYHLEYLLADNAITQKEYDAIVS